MVFFHGFLGPAADKRGNQRGHGQGSGQPPPPQGAAAAHGDKVMRSLAKLIAAHGGFIDFAQYMQHALYAPGLGYYSAGSEKLGAAGDFVTAPLISPLFGRVIGRYLLRRYSAEAFAEMNILELGAGNGAMAADILLCLQENRALPEAYLILEPAADMARRQKANLQRRVPDLLERVQWLEALPAAGTFNGVIIANEVIDALPAQRFTMLDGEIRRVGVGLEGERLCWKTTAFEQGFHDTVARRLPAAPAAYPHGYRSEACLLLDGWVAALAEALETGETRGEILLFDYGYERRHYYAPGRNDGTVRAHYRQHAVYDALVYPGLADVTVWVDFTALAQAAAAAGLAVTGYTTQASFLIQHGMLDLLQAQMDTRPSADYLAAAEGVKKLLEPGEMGETVKVMRLVRGGRDEPEASDFGRDFRYRL